MLQNIHDKAKGWVAYAIVGFIAIPFTLFGISSYLGNSGSLVAAIVNGEEIAAQEVQNSVLQQRQRLTQMFGGKLPPNFNDGIIKQQALEQIVNQTLLRQEAEAGGYRASNQEVYDRLASISAFQKEGRFDAKTYDRVLASQRRNKANFELDIRNEITNQQLSQGVSQSAFMPVSELARYQQLENQTRSAETYTFKKADFESTITVSADEIKNYFDSNAANYKTKERVKLSYILLKQEDLEKAVDANNDVLQAYYDENAERYIDPEQRKLAHILVKIDAKKDGANADKKAKEKAQAFYDQIKSGAKTFEDLASNDSDDSFTAKKSGEIGLIVAGDMGPLFEKAAFALKKGDISEVVKAEAGYEIIKVLDVIASKQKTFDDVKAEIEKTYRRDEAEKTFLEYSDKLQTLAFENESSLDAAADSVGMKITTSDWIERGTLPTTKDIASPKILQAAFSDDVLAQGKNSELIELDASTVAVVRLQEHELPKPKTLADVSDEIQATLKNQKVRKLLIEKGEAALKAIQVSGSWSAVESVGGSADKIEKLVVVKRNDNKVAAIIVDKLFSMQKPEGDKKSFDSTILPEGDYVLIGLQEVNNGSTELDAELQKSFTQMLASRERTAMLKALRESAKVELFPENIQ